MKWFLPRPPSAPLIDGRVELSLPSPGDVPTLAAYGADPALLEGIWVSGSAPAEDPFTWASTRLSELLAGWEAPGGPHGATLTAREEGQLVGFVYMSPRDGEAVELSYGIAPPARGRGLALRP